MILVIQAILIGGVIFFGFSAIRLVFAAIVALLKLLACGLLLSLLSG